MDKNKSKEQLIIDGFYSLFVQHINKNGSIQLQQYINWKSHISTKLTWVILHLAIHSDRDDDDKEKNRSSFALDFILQEMEGYDPEILLNYCTGIEAPDLIFIDHLSFEFNVNSNWLLYGEGLPFIENNNSGIDHTT
ncbi:hypothetical protein KBV65_002745 [Salmonella enterica]|nr:hypothetical protein [Salmonella enterica]